MFFTVIFWLIMHFTFTMCSVLHTHTFSVFVSLSHTHTHTHTLALLKGKKMVSGPTKTSDGTTDPGGARQERWHGDQCQLAAFPPSTCFTLWISFWLDPPALPPLTLTPSLSPCSLSLFLLLSLSLTHTHTHTCKLFSLTLTHTHTHTQTNFTHILCLFPFFAKNVGWLLACLTSQQHASVSQGRICTDNFTCCHTEIEAADQTFHLTQSQYTDTGPASPSADPIMPGTWQGSHWSANV